MRLRVAEADFNPCIIDETGWLVAMPLGFGKPSARVLRDLNDLVLRYNAHDALVRAATVALERLDALAQEAPISCDDVRTMLREAVALGAGEADGES